MSEELPEQAAELRGNNQRHIVQGGGEEGDKECRGPPGSGQ